MHAGFAALRAECSMDIVRRGEPAYLSRETLADVARIEAIIDETRREFGAAGPFLFGDFTYADAMYVPVVLRFVSYGVEVRDETRAYMKAIVTLPALAKWIAGARAEPYPRILPGGRVLEHAMTKAEATRFAQAWADAWNRLDLDAVLAHYDDEAIFVSPRAEAVVGSAYVRGKSALEAYWRRALETIESLHFDVDDVAWDASTRTLVVSYDIRRNGERARACESMRFDGAGRIFRGEALYGAVVGA
jgi:ketosteroid isomerase-like protein